MELRLDSIPLGREGFVYLLHAEGTDRYKIGRSVNPIGRCADIQKQSPYPLKIVKSRWSLDAVTDEIELHKNFAEYRVFGEWFDLVNENPGRYNRRLGDVETSFDYLLTMSRFTNRTIKWVWDWLKNKGIKQSEESWFLGSSIIDLYQKTTSKEDLVLVENFMYNVFFELVGSTYPGHFSGEDGYLFEDAELYMCGAIACFGYTGLSKRGGNG